MTALLTVSPSIEFAVLPAAVRAEIDLLDRLIKQTLVAPRGTQMAAYEAAARQLTAQGRKMSASGFRALCGQYVKDKCDWRTLIDWRKVPHDENRIPAPFLAYARSKMERQGRSAKQAYGDIVSEWRAGKPIPGYAVPAQPDAFTGLPRGWSASNVFKKCKSTPFEKAAMRVGLGYAKAKHGPKHFTSRAGLWPGSHYMFDDVDHDHFVYVGQRNQQCRVSQIGALDVLSGNYFAWGTRPQLQRFDAKLKKNVTDGIKEADMRYLLARVLLDFGYNTRGTELIVERGTATIRENVARLLHDRSGGIITVNLGGWTGKEQVVEGMFTGKGGGNPRHKAPIEAFHSLLHNGLGAQPGQTGPDVTRRPEQLAGLLKANGDLMAASQMLEPYRSDQLKFILSEYHTEFIPALGDVLRAINGRTQHKLEGYAKCGFLTRDYRFHRESKDWLTQNQFLALPQGTREMLEVAVSNDAACFNPRLMSPTEVFGQGRNQLTLANAGWIAEMLYSDLAAERLVRECSCRNGYFEIHDKEIDPEVLRYDSRVHTLDGHVDELTPDTYEVVVNPFQPDLLWVYNGKRGQGGFLGIARRTLQPGRADRSGNGTALAVLRERHAALAAPLTHRHRDLARQEARRLENNIEVMAGPSSPEEARVEAGRCAQPGEGALSDLMEPEAAPTEPAPEIEESISDLL
jgi:hypothetical protein